MSLLYVLIAVFDALGGGGGGGGGGVNIVF